MSHHVRKKIKSDPTFSKNLLGLKFMKGARERIEKKDKPEETPSIKDHCVITASYQFCENLRFGRLSFQCMNPEIEALMVNEGFANISTGSLKRAAPPSLDSSDDEYDDLFNVDCDDIGL